MMHSEKEYPRRSPSSAVTTAAGSQPGSRHQSVGSSDASSIIALAEYLQAQQAAQLAAQQLAAPGPIDLSGAGAAGPTITLEQLSNIHHYRSTQQHQQSESALYDGSLLGSMLQSQHYHLNGPPSPGSPVAGLPNPTSPAASVYNGHHGSGTMSPTKKLSKPLIEKRRRDRINRCLRLLKELVIDSKRFPVANLNKSRFEKADILEITVKYLMTTQQEERRAFQMGFNTCHQEILKLVQELTQANKEQDGSNEEAMVQGEEDEATLEEAPSKPSTSNTTSSGADLDLVKQLCSRLTALGEQLAAEQQAHAQRTASLTNLVLELSEIKSRSASITSDHSGEVTPTSLGHREHGQSPSIEDLLQLDGMRLYESDEEPSPLMLKQYFSRQQGSPSTTASGSSGVIKHTSNYHPQEGGQVKQATSGTHWPMTTSGNLPNNPASMLLEGHHLAPSYHQRSSSLSTGKSTSSSSSSASSSSSSSSSTSSTSVAISPSATSFFKPGQPTAVDPSLINFTQSPFFTELNMSGGNERNSGAMSNYEAIWRPWGFNA